VDVDGREAHKFITGAMERGEFRFALIRDWLVSVAKTS